MITIDLICLKVFKMTGGLSLVEIGVESFASDLYELAKKLWHRNSG